MTIEQWAVQRVACDEPGCVSRGPRSEYSSIDARCKALDAGWQRWATVDTSETPTVFDFLDLCPAHHRP